MRKLTKKQKREIQVIAAKRRGAAMGATSLPLMVSITDTRLVPRHNTKIRWWPSSSAIG